MRKATRVIGHAPTALSTTAVFASLYVLSINTLNWVAAIIFAQLSYEDLGHQLRVYEPASLIPSAVPLALCAKTQSTKAVVVVAELPFFSQKLWILAWLGCTKIMTLMDKWEKYTVHTGCFLFPAREHDLFSCIKTHSEEHLGHGIVHYYNLHFSIATTLSSSS